jgi:predicted MarR family transcription regulator
MYFATVKAPCPIEYRQAKGYPRGSWGIERNRMPARSAVAKPRQRAKYPDPPLGRSERERSFLEFEQALICASEAFYRFAGIILGTEGKAANLTGHENVILQQLMYLPKPRSVSDLSRFTNRDDISNIQYSLRKLALAGLIEKVPGTANRDTRYRPTAAGRALTEAMVNRRRELLINPSTNLKDVEAQLRAATAAMSLLTGLYDHVSRVLTGRF